MSAINRIGKKKFNYLSVALPKGFLKRDNIAEFPPLPVRGVSPKADNNVFNSSFENVGMFGGKSPVGVSCTVFNRSSRLDFKNSACFELNGGGAIAANGVALEPGSSPLGVTAMIHFKT